MHCATACVLYVRTYIQYSTCVYTGGKDKQRGGMVHIKQELKARNIIQSRNLNLFCIYKRKIGIKTFQKVRKVT